MFLNFARLHVEGFCFLALVFFLCGGGGRVQGLGLRVFRARE